MGFIMDGLDAEEYDRQYSDRVLVRRIGRYFRPQLPRMAVVSLMIPLSTLANTGPADLYLAQHRPNCRHDTTNSRICDHHRASSRFWAAWPGCLTPCGRRCRRGRWVMWCCTCAKTLSTR